MIDGTAEAKGAGSGRLPADTVLDEFHLDAERLRQQRADGARRLHTQQIPAARAIGFLLMCGVTLLHASRIGFESDRTAAIALCVLNLVYAVVAAGVTWRWWGRVGRFDITLALLHIDLLVWLPTLYFFEQYNPLVGVLLLVRVADQVGFGARRAVYFTHLVVGVYLLYAFVEQATGDARAAPSERVAVATALYIAGLYISMTGLVTEGLRRRVRSAVRSGRQLLARLAQQTVSLEAQTHELERARVAAETASVAKSQFLATISHEIRTPMSGILGTTELMLAGPLSEPQRRLARTAHVSAVALLGIIDDVLDFSRIEAGGLRLEPAAFEPRQLVHDVLDLMRPAAATRSLSLADELPPELPALLVGDAARLRQVLVNLLANAIKFTEHGRVTLRVVVGEEEPSGVSLRFEVDDSGVGIAEADQGRIFDPFTQGDASTARRHGGSGLGLSIVRELVRLMGGEVAVRSRIGLGSNFWFTLQLPRAGGDGAGREPAAEPSLPNLAGRVLVAEDHEVNQIVLRAMLERLGCEVEVVADGAQAAEACAQREFDVVLMDCHMPVIDGFEATRRIREREHRGSRSRVPILALTAAALAEDRDKCLACGMDDHLSKPVSLPLLAAALLRWLQPAPAAEAADGRQALRGTG